MGYFSNGTEGDIYEEKYCNKCVHLLEQYGCPCLLAHLMWNYEECNKPDSVLHKMIPRTADGWNGKCFAFQEAKGE